MILIYHYLYDFYISEFLKYKLLICHFHSGYHIPTYTYSSITLITVYGEHVNANNWKYLCTTVNNYEHN